MNISVDYDGTITSDEPTFFKMMQLFKKAGHKVYIVTMRYPSETNALLQDWVRYVDGIYFTGRRAKKPFMEQLGIKIDIWIDDNPNAIYLNAGQIWGTESPEGIPVTPPIPENKT